MAMSCSAAVVAMATAAAVETPRMQAHAGDVGEAKARPVVAVMGASQTK